MILERSILRKKKIGEVKKLSLLMYTHIFPTPKAYLDCLEYIQSLVDSG